MGCNPNTNRQTLKLSPVPAAFLTARLKERNTCMLLDRRVLNVCSDALPVLPSNFMSCQLLHSIAQAAASEPTAPKPPTTVNAPLACPALPACVDLAR